MKIKKIISALLISAMIFGMSALAADVKFDDAVTYTAGAETVTVNVYAGSNVTKLDGYSLLSITFDDDVFSVKTASTTQESATAVDNGDGTVSWCNETTSETTITSDPLMTVVFNVLDSSKVVGSTFGIDEGNSALIADAGETIYDLSGVSVTVTAAGGNQGGDVDLTTPKAGAEITVNEGTLAGKKVVVTTYEGIANEITASTKVKVTYEGEEPKLFGSIFEELKAQGGGTITSGKIVFGVVCSTELDASKFSFALVD